MNKIIKFTAFIIGFIVYAITTAFISYKLDKKWVFIVSLIIITIIFVLFVIVKGGDIMPTKKKKQIKRKRLDEEIEIDEDSLFKNTTDELTIEEPTEEIEEFIEEIEEKPLKKQSNSAPIFSHEEKAGNQEKKISKNTPASKKTSDPSPDFSNKQKILLDEIRKLNEELKEKQKEFFKMMGVN